MSKAEKWYEEQGRILISNRKKKYKGIKAWLGNFNFVPRGIEMKDLAPLIRECPVKYDEEVDDILLYL